MIMNLFIAMMMIVSEKKSGLKRVALINYQPTWTRGTSWHEESGNDDVDADDDDEDCDNGDNGGDGDDDDGDEREEECFEIKQPAWTLECGTRVLIIVMAMFVEMI